MVPLIACILVKQHESLLSLSFPSSLCGTELRNFAHLTTGCGAHPTTSGTSIMAFVRICCYVRSKSSPSNAENGMATMQAKPTMFVVDVGRHNRVLATRNTSQSYIEPTEHTQAITKTQTMPTARHQCTHLTHRNRQHIQNNSMLVFSPLSPRTRSKRTKCEGPQPHHQKCMSDKAWKPHAVTDTTRGQQSIRQSNEVNEKHCAGGKHRQTL